MCASPSPLSPWVPLRLGSSILCLYFSGFASRSAIWASSLSASPRYADCEASIASCGFLSRSMGSSPSPAWPWRPLAFTSSNLCRCASGLISTSASKPSSLFLCKYVIQGASGRYRVLKGRLTSQLLLRTYYLSVMVNETEKAMSNRCVLCVLL
jgi:hypothetical protein